MPITRKTKDSRLTAMEPYTQPRPAMTSPMTSRTRATTTSAPLMTITGRVLREGERAWASY
jgi:hypothetical protein